jgi:hypothetical protein
LSLPANRCSFRIHLPEQFKTSALSSLTSGADNTAIGFQALFSNTSGTYNSGEGFRALFSNTTGVFNTATGVQALNSNTTRNGPFAGSEIDEEMFALYHECSPNHS